MTNPYAAWWQTWFKTWEMALAAPVVVALRLQGMAAARAAARSTQALWQQPWAMAAVAVAPAHRRVVANRRRL